MNKDLIDVEVSEALSTLRKKYPGQRVGIRLWLEDGPVAFFASVEHMTAPGDYQCAHAQSAHEAVEKLIAQVGEHSQREVAEIKIAQLEEELANLRRGLESIGAVACGDNEPAGQHEGYGHHQPTAP